MSKMTVSLYNGFKDTSGTNLLITVDEFITLLVDDSTEKINLRSFLPMHTSTGKRTKNDLYMDEGSSTYLVLDCDSKESSEKTYKFLKNNKLLNNTIAQESFSGNGKTHYFLLISNLNKDKYIKLLEYVKVLSTIIGFDSHNTNYSQIIASSNKLPTKLGNTIEFIDYDELLLKITTIIDKSDIIDETSPNDANTIIEPSNKLELESKLSKFSDKRYDELFKLVKKVFRTLGVLRSNKLDYMQAMMHPSEKSKGNLYMYSNNPYLINLSSPNSKFRLSENDRYLVDEKSNTIKVRYLDRLVESIAENFNIDTSTVLKAKEVFNTEVLPLLRTCKLLDMELSELSNILRDNLTPDLVFSFNGLFGYNWTRGNNRLYRSILEVMKDYGFIVINGSGRRPAYITCPSSKTKIDEFLDDISKVLVIQDEFLDDYQTYMESNANEVATVIDNVYNESQEIVNKLNTEDNHLLTKNLTELPLDNLLSIQKAILKYSFELSDRLAFIHAKFQSYYKNIYKTQLQDLNKKVFNNELYNIKYIELIRFTHRYFKIKDNSYTKVYKSYSVAKVYIITNLDILKDRICESDYLKYKLTGIVNENNLELQFLVTEDEIKTSYYDSVKKYISLYITRKKSEFLSNPI